MLTLAIVSALSLWSSSFTRGVVHSSRRALRGSTLNALDPGSYPKEWMNALGSGTTQSDGKWALPMDPDSLGPGSVVIAVDGSYHHTFIESIVLVTEHGEGITRGVLLTGETPMTVSDVAPGSIDAFAENTVFMGGDAGSQSLVMIHGESALPGALEIGRGVYIGGVRAAAEAVEAGALPAERFKFFYKSVEWLPDALEMQVTSGIFRVIDLSPGWLYGQSGSRMMWREVTSAVEEEEEEARGGVVDEAMRSSAADVHLQDASPGLAGQLSRAASVMRQQRDRQRAATEAVREEEAERSEAARLAHDAKVAAYVEQLLAERGTSPDEQAGGVEDGDSEAVVEPAPFMAGATPESTRSEAAATEEAAAEEEEVGPSLTWEQMTQDPEAAAAKAAAWLAERGIFAPPDQSTRESRVASDGPVETSMATEAARAQEGEQTEEVLEQPPVDAQDAARVAEAGVPEEASAVGIEALLGYRVSRGNEQWRVRWKGYGQDADTWEVWQVLDTEALRRHADALRVVSRG